MLATRGSAQRQFEPATCARRWDPGSVPNPDRSGAGRRRYRLTPIEGLLVDGEPEKRHWRVHFSIGQAF